MKYKIAKLLQKLGLLPTTDELADMLVAELEAGLKMSLPADLLLSKAKDLFYDV